MNIFRETLAQIRNISILSPDPIRAERAMMYRLSCNVKMCKKFLTKDLINSLYSRKIGTKEVDEYARRLCKYGNNKNKRISKMICFIMKDKLEDAENETKKAAMKFAEATDEYRKIIQVNGTIDEWFKAMMKRETERIWAMGKKKNRNKIETLIKKRKRYNEGVEPINKYKDKMSTIMYKDDDLDNLEERNDQTYNNKSEVYGGAVINEKVEKILSKEPGFMVYNKIDNIEIEVEIEKGISKARYELMNRGEENGDGSEDEDIESNRNRTQEDFNKVLQYNNLRATDIPTVQRLIEPKLGPISKEVVMESTKQKLLECARAYKATHCKREGEIKGDNLSMDERQGLKQIKKEIKDKKVVVFTTDKSGKFSVDTPDNYNVAVQKHTMKDEEMIGEDEERKIENKMNHHMRQLNKIFQVGSTHEHESRVMGATMSTNTPAPPMYGLRKDHKAHEDKVVGPPVRPVCGASESPNSKLSTFLSRIINDYAESVGIETECRSSEEMKAAFEKFNQRETSERKDCRVISMDVKALYPSMEIGNIVEAVRELVEVSEKQVEGVDWTEVGKYLAIVMTNEEIEEEGLKHVVPKRKTQPNRKVSIAYLSNKKNDENWGPARTPGHRQKKKMLGLTIACAVRTCIQNHLYKVGDKIFLQREGGPIGLELTGAVSRAFMWRWDKLYLEKAREAGIDIVLYERYVDDSNQVAAVPERGARYDRMTKRVVIDERLEGIEEKEDERLARVLLDIANDILQCIQMEADWPSKNADNRLPILDMKVWVDNEGTILYSHYEKPMSNKAVLNSKSAHPAACKRSVHTQEILRRMLNCSRRLNWDKETAPVISDYMLRMRKAGYRESYRKSMLVGALNIYEQKIKDDKDLRTPLFRDKCWKKEERRKEKLNKKKEWATKRGHIAPIFVPATPGGELARRMKAIADKEAEKGIHFNIVEMGGKTLKSEVQRSNPTATPGCERKDCLGCSMGRGKGGRCHKNNVNYKIECLDCPEDERATYIGETSKNLYTRTSQHVNGRQDEDSFMRKHEEEKHDGRQAKYRARVTNTNRDCLTRQVREGVMIRRCLEPVMNSRAEWFQPPVFGIQNEIVRE